MKRTATISPTDFSQNHRPSSRTLAMRDLGLALRCRQGMPLANRRGSALIALIAAVVLFSLLAAAILPLVSSSSQQSASAGLATKAYLLAESGFRYAASRFMHAGASAAAKYDMLENLDGGNYTLDNNDGQFELHVFSYFYEIIRFTGPNSFKAHAPGTFPNTEITIAANSQVSIGNEVYILQPGSQAVTGEDDNVTMILDRPLTAVPLRTPVNPVAIVSGDQAVTNGANLNYNAGDGAMLPLRNGQIQVDGQTLTYRLNDRTNNSLLDLQDPSNPSLNVVITNGSQIVLNPYARLVSIGRIGSDQVRTERQVQYFTPLPLSATASERVRITERFDSTANWTAGAGSHAIGQTGASGDNALVVTGTSPLDTVYRTSLAVFNPTTGTHSSIFNASYGLNGGYLSYDVQAKIGYYLNPTPPDLGYYPAAPIPAYVAAGISFRVSPVVNGAYNGYGVSFMRGRYGAMGGDRIPDAMVPTANQRVIVLWQQTANGTDRNWLAYKNIAQTIPVDTSFETSDGNWTETGSSASVTWHRSTRKSHSGSYAYYYGNDTSGTYDTGTSSNHGELTFGPVTLCDDDSVRLSFYSWHDTETENPNNFDLKDVQIRYDQGGGTWSAWTDLLRISTAYPSRQWNAISQQLCDYAGRTVEIRFSFDTVDYRHNDYEGWYIDDVRITCDWPIDEATLLVRQVEAAALAFTDGGPEAVQKGDEVYGYTSGARGVMARAPVLTNDDWTNGNAQGLLLLNSVSGAFQNGEDLYVLGKGQRATLTTYDANEDDHNNIILVYYARPNACGTRDDDPLDAAKGAYPRLASASDELRWPPDEGGNWTAADDYFRLVQWDVINDGSVSNLSAVDFLSRTGDLVHNSLIRSYDPDLRSPPSGSGFLRPELGLHTFGDGSLNIFFDDFGVQIDVRPTNTFTQPLQQ